MSASTTLGASQAPPTPPSDRAAPAPAPEHAAASVPETCTTNQSATASDDDVPPCTCGAAPPCPPELRSLASPYLRLRGCALVPTRQRLPRVPRENLAPWNDFRRDVLDAVFCDVFAEGASSSSSSSSLADELAPFGTKDPALAPSSTSNTPPEAAFSALLADRVLPSIRRVVLGAAATLRPDLIHAGVESAPPPAASAFGRGHVPDLCAMGVSPKPGPDGLILFSAGVVTSETALKSSHLEGITTTDDDGTMDALRHMAYLALATRSRYVFAATPAELVAVRFSTGPDGVGSTDPAAVKAMHAEWARAPWHGVDPNNGLSYRAAVALVVLLGVADSARMVGPYGVARPVNGWKREDGGEGFSSVVNGRQKTAGLPESGMLVE